MMEYELANNILNSSIFESRCLSDDLFYKEDFSSKNNIAFTQNFSENDLSFSEFNLSDFLVECNSSTNILNTAGVTAYNYLDLFDEFHPSSESINKDGISSDGLDIDLSPKDSNLFDDFLERGNESVSFQQNDDKISFGSIDAPLGSPDSSVSSASSSQLSVDSISFGCIETPLGSPISSAASSQLSDDDILLGGMETPLGSPMSSAVSLQLSDDSISFGSIETPLESPFSSGGSFSQSDDYMKSFNRMEAVLGSLSSSVYSAGDVSLDFVDKHGSSAMNNTLEEDKVSFLSLNILDKVAPSPSSSLVLDSNHELVELISLVDDVSSNNDIDKNIASEHTYAKSPESEKQLASFEDLSPRSVDSGISSDNDNIDLASQFFNIELSHSPNASGLETKFELGRQISKTKSCNVSNVRFSPYENTDKQQKSPEQKIRKKKQNRDAALKYRSKKKSQTHQVFSEAAQLEEKNKELKSSVESIEKEIDYLKKLMMDVLNARLTKSNINLETFIAGLLCQSQ